jgi:hypothetical protein
MAADGIRGPMAGKSWTVFALAIFLAAVPLPQAEAQCAGTNEGTLLVGACVNAGNPTGSFYWCWMHLPALGWVACVP